MKKFLLFFSLLALPCQASAFCFEPSEPYCANSYGPFDSRYEFDSCKREVESYLDDLRDYAICVAREVQEKQNEAIENFNRRACDTRNSY